jgi:hypothetical protein
MTREELAALYRREIELLDAEPEPGTEDHVIWMAEMEQVTSALENYDGNLRPAEATIQ